MGEDELSWFYVGNGQLRAKDSNGWTDEYQDIDGPERIPNVGLDAHSDLPEEPSGDTERARAARVRSSLARLCMSAARLLIAGLIWLTGVLVRLMAAFWRLIVKGYRQASLSLSVRSIARQRRGGLVSAGSALSPSRPAVGRHRQQT
jgi:hypothetical protein